MAHFGLSLEAELDGIENSAHQSKRKVNPKTIEGKKRRAVEKWLDLPRRYRQPTATAASDREL